MSENILDKIIKANEDEKKAELDPQELVNFLLKDLNSREKEIIRARYGLDRPEHQTLEAIGKRFNITRERVRQIENNGLKKALATEGKEEKLQYLLNTVLKSLHKTGYIAHEDSLLNELTENSAESKVDKNCLIFIFSKFLMGYIEPVDIIHTEKAWRVKDKDVSHYEPLIEGVKSVLIEKDEPLKLSEIVEALENVIDDKIKEFKNEIENWEDVIHSYLKVSKHFKKNLFDKWGLKDWRSVNPKRMRDKIYLVMVKDSKPLHYKKIADRINEEKFDSKVAHPATIHNELILDKRFVLIGRGIYALAEWGYKPGVISEVVFEVLEKAAHPLTKEEIMEEVLKRRMVKEGSINLTLSDRDNFIRLEDGRYTIKK